MKKLILCLIAIFSLLSVKAQQYIEGDYGIFKESILVGDDSVVYVVYQDTLVNPDFVRTYVANNSPSAASDTIFISGPDKWIGNNDTIDTVAVALVAVNASADSSWTKIVVGSGGDTLIIDTDGTVRQYQGGVLVYSTNIYGSISTDSVNTNNIITSSSSSNVNFGLYNSPSGPNRGSIMLGYTNLFNNTLSSNNIAIGVSNSYSTVSGGNGNIGIGTGNNFNNLTGDNNIGIGHSSFYLNTVGNGNIGIGYSAGKYLTSPSYVFAINSIDRSTENGDSTKSILIGFQDAVRANQKLYLNAHTYTDTLTATKVKTDTLELASGAQITGTIGNLYLNSDNGTFYFTEDNVDGAGWIIGLDSIYKIDENQDWVDRVALLSDIGSYSGGSSGTRDSLEVAQSTDKVLKIFSDTNEAYYDYVELEPVDTVIWFLSSQVNNGDSILCLPEIGSDSVYKIDKATMIYNYGTTAYTATGNSYLIANRLGSASNIFYLGNTNIQAINGWCYQLQSAGGSILIDAGSAVWFDWDDTINNGDGIFRLIIEYETLEL